MEVLKRLTGRDFIRARRLFENGNKFVIFALLVLSVNVLPNIVELDNGTWRRMRVIKFQSTFTLVPEEVNEEENLYLADPELKKWYAEFVPCFMGILLDHYKVCQREGLKVPQSVLDETNEFRVSQNVYEQFISDACKLDPEARIHVTTLWQACQRWATANNVKGVDRKSMADYMTKREQTNKDKTYNMKLNITWRGLNKCSTGYEGITINTFTAENISASETPVNNQV